MTIQQISVFLANKPGSIAEVLNVLHEAGVDLNALTVADASQYGVMRMIANDPKKALDALKGYAAGITDVIAVRIDDSPGKLAEILNLLKEAQISVEYLYAFVAPVGGSAYCVLRVADNAEAEACLLKHGVTLASPEDLYDI
jgi:ACT domain-containing protein